MYKRWLIRLGLPVAAVVVVALGISSLFNGCTGGGLGGNGLGPGPGPGAKTNIAGDGPTRPTTETKTPDKTPKKPDEPKKKIDEPPPVERKGIEREGDTVVVNVYVVADLFRFDGRTVDLADFLKDVQKVVDSYPGKPVKVLVWADRGNAEPADRLQNALKAYPVITVFP